MIDNNIEHLKDPCRIKAKVLLEVFRTRCPNIAIFETLRSKTRQIQLMAKKVSWTYNSKHLVGMAVDWVFMNKNNQPTRVGDYYLLQRIAEMCGLKRIKQELCHTEDNGIAIGEQMRRNSQRYINSQDNGEKYRLHLVNETFRKYLNPTK